MTISEEETREALLDSLAVPLPTLTEGQRTIEEEVKKNIEESATRLTEPDVTEQEILMALNSQNPSKAPGPDEIPVTFYKETFPTLGPNVLALFQQCLNLRHFPASFKRGEVIFIPKPDKKGDLPNHYRPITLLNTLAKCLERVLVERLKFHEEEGKWFSEAHYGFQEKISAEDAVCRLTNTIQTNYKRKLETMVTFFDVSGAFNEMYHGALLHRLAEKKCPTPYLAMITSYLKDREITSGESKRIMKRGTPQGSVLSPWLWNAFYDDIYGTIKTACPQALPILFADDLAVSITSEDRWSAARKMNRVIRAVALWGKKNILRFNPDKTKAVLFSRLRQKDDTKTMIIMDGKRLQLSPSAKYLGVILDKRLTWKEHIEWRCGAAKRLLHALNGAIHANWGLNGSTIKTIYEMAVVPAILYGAAAWIEGLEKDNKRQLLTKIQRQAALKTTRCLRTTATETLIVLAGMRPINMVVKERVACTTQRQVSTKKIDAKLRLNSVINQQKTSKNNTSSVEVAMAMYAEFKEATKDTIKYTLEDMPRKHPATQRKSFIKISEQEEAIKEATKAINPGRYTTEWKETTEEANIELAGTKLRTFERRTSMILATKDEARSSTLAQEEGERKWPANIPASVPATDGKSIIYTDASKMVGSGVGFATIVIQEGLTTVTQGCLKETHSVYQGELTALLVAAWHARIITGDTEIYTDAQSVLLMLQNEKKLSPAAIQIKNIIDDKIKLNWTPGHKGVIGNEAADQLAKQAAKSTRRIDDGINEKTLLKKYILDKTMQKWQQQWDNAITGRAAYGVKPKVSTDTHSESAVANRVASGHYYCGSYAKRFKLQASDECPRCKVPETIEHILISCKAHQDLRNTFKIKTNISLKTASQNIGYLKKIDEARRTRR